MYEFISYRVKDVMAARLVMVNEEVTLSEVGDIFEKHDFNGIPVVDGRCRLIGMMTKLDFLKAFVFTEKSKIPQYDAVMDQTISSLFTRNPRVVSPETPLTRVLKYMIETGYKSFPVTHNDRVVGMVAREDILRGLRQAARGEGPVWGGGV